MKKAILSIAVMSLFTAVQAQTATGTPQKTNVENQRQKPSPEKMAAHEANKLTADLGLSADQKTKVEALALDRIKTVEPLKEQQKEATDETQKKSIHQQIKAAKEKYFADVKAILTPDQQTKWEQMREEMKEKHQEKKDK